MSSQISALHCCLLRTELPIETPKSADFLSIIMIIIVVAVATTAILVVDDDDDGKYNHCHISDDSHFD